MLHVKEREKIQKKFFLPKCVTIVFVLGYNWWKGVIKDISGGISSKHFYNLVDRPPANRTVIVIFAHFLGTRVAVNPVSRLAVDERAIRLPFTTTSAQFCCIFLGRGYVNFLGRCSAPYWWCFLRWDAARRGGRSVHILRSCSTRRTGSTGRFVSPSSSVCGSRW